MAALDVKDLASIDKEIDDKGKKYVTYPWLAVFLMSLLGGVFAMVLSFHQAAKADMRDQLVSQNSTQAAIYCDKIESLKTLITSKFETMDERMKAIENLHPRRAAQ
jgi:hypothetical protein